MSGRERRFTPTFSATKGVMFIAVPHDGADIAILAKRISAIMQVAVNVNRRMLKGLTHNSSSLQEISKEFSSLGDFPVVTVTESEKTPIPYVPGQSILVSYVHR
jgi:hypothetical protein